MNKYLALQKDVFDISKVTVVGSPTITSDGVASGFSREDYITVPFDSTQDFIVEYTFVQGAGYWNGYTIANGIECYHYNDNAWLDTYWRHSAGATHTGRVGFIKGATYKIIYKRLSNVLNTKIYIDGVLSSDNDLDLSTFTDKAYTTLDIGKLNPYGDATVDNTVSIDLKQLKITQNGVTYSPTKPTYLLERRKPKVWNKGQFTIVGNPSISESGIASGFSASNYITSKAVNLSTTKWEIKAKFKTNANGVVNGKVYALSKDFTNEGRFGIGLGFVQDGKFEITDTNDNATAWGGNALSSILASPNTTFYTKHYFDGTNIKLDISTDGRNYTNIITKVKTNNFIAFKSLEFGNLNKAVNFTGSIDLKEFKIYVDNNLVFDGGADTYIYDPSKFTVVGSPTITEYGVASGFTSQDYFRMPLLKDGGQVEKIRIKFNLLGSVSTASRMIARLHETNLMIFTNNIGNINVAQPPSFGTQYFFDRQPKDYYADCIIEVILNKNSKELFVSYYENDVLIYSKTVSSTMASLLNISSWADGATNSNGYWYLGCQGFSGGFLGSIDLPQFSITVDGKEVFTGAKENYYMLRR